MLSHEGSCVMTALWSERMRTTEMMQTLAFERD